MLKRITKSNTKEPIYHIPTGWTEFQFWEEASKRLYEFEEAEENGLLFRLPLKIGTRVDYRSDINLDYDENVLIEGYILNNRGRLSIRFDNGKSFYYDEIYKIRERKED